MNILKGHYQNESGSLDYGTLHIEKTNTGFKHLESNADLKAIEFKVCEGFNSVIITGDNFIHNFLPNEGELERLGIKVEKLNEA